MIEIIQGDIAAAKMVVHVVTVIMAGVCAYAVIELLGRWLFGMFAFPAFYGAGLLAYVAMMRGRVSFSSNPLVESLIASGVGITVVVGCMIAVNMIIRSIGEPARQARQIREQIHARSKTDQRTRSVLK